jgi:hypothetical protein
MMQQPAKDEIQSYADSAYNEYISRYMNTTYFHYYQIKNRKLATQRF